MATLRELRDALPPYAADLAANLDALEDDRTLSAQERWGCLFACGFATGVAGVARPLAEAAAEPLGEAGVAAAKAAVAVTAMNDIYYGLITRLQHQDYATLPSGLRMEALHHPGVDRNAFELWCLSVSALEGCAACVDAQDGELRHRGAPPERMQTAIRIAAVVGGVARVLAAAAALKADGDDEREGGEPAPGADADKDEASGEGAPPDDPAQRPHPAPAPGGIAPG